MTPEEKANRELVASIKHGDRVTFVTHRGQEMTGTAVMHSSHGGWVLNLGGKHGTPGLVDHTNILRVQRQTSREPKPSAPFWKR